jgi:predicted DCC family thiol-disulfide oxidoreductase YuxK
VAAQDPEGNHFRFAPIGGETMLRRLSDSQIAALPDSIVLQETDGRVWVRSEAALRIGRRLGGVWAGLAMLGGGLPRPLRDGIYRLVARHRHRLFARPEGVCPRVAPELRERFLP